jgi:outer membrane protein TolC
MKKLLILQALCAFTLLASAQTTTKAPANTANVPDSLIMRKLVELATTGPSFKLAEHQENVLQYQLKGAKNNWMNLLTVSMNYNDLQLKGQNSTYVYPKYFFGLNIPLGTLLSRTQVKATREQIKAKEEQKEILVRSLKTEILKMYLQYKNYNDLILLQTNVIDDEEATFAKAKEDFKEGSITIETYNQSQKRYNDEVVKGKQLELDREILKLQIEEVIGVTLDEAIQQAAAMRKK